MTIVLVTCAAFSPTLQNDFVSWDDDRNFLENPFYRGLGWSELRWMFTTFHMGHYQPLSWITLGLDYLLWGMNPFGYHLTNLVLHAANAMLFYFVGLRLLSAAFSIAPGEKSWRLTVSAGLAALLFGIHPLRVESVAWVTERRDVLSGLFYFTTIFYYLRAQETQVDNERRRWMGISLLVYALSLLSKATAMTLPVVLLLLDAYPLKRLRLEWPVRLNSTARRILLEKFPFLILAVLFAVIALFAQQRTGALRPAYNYFVSYRAGQAFYGLCFYLWKTLMPVSLSPLYELPYDFDAWMPLFWLCAALVTSISVVLFLVRRRWPALLACWLYYLLAVAPLLGVAQSGPQLVADRYSYLSCLSWSLLGGAVFYQFLNSIGDRANRRGRFAASAALASALILILSTLAWKQTKVWRDSKTLWEHVITTGSDPAIARYNMARIFEHEGKLSESIKYYRRAIEIYPTYADAHYNLARLLAKSGEQTQAIYHYRQALRFTPDDAETLNNLALLLAVRGETDEALKYLRRAVQANPNYPQAFYNIGRILAGQGYYAEAISNHQQALKLKPDQAEIHFELGKALAGQGRMEEAAGFFQSAIALKPDFPAAHVALSQLLAEQGKNDSDAQRYPEARRRSETRNQDRLSP